MLMVLDAVCRLKSTTKVAEELNISQPAVSQSLKRLRDIVGNDLFIRTPNSLEPTEAGLELWKYALEALSICEKIVDYSSDAYDPYQESDSFRVAITMLDIEYFIRNLTLHSLQKFPDIGLQIMNVNRKLAFNDLETRKLDAYIGFKSDDIPKTIEMQWLFDVEFDVVCSKACSLYTAGTVSKDQFINKTSLTVYTHLHESILDDALKRNGLMQKHFFDLPDLASVPLIMKNKDCLFLTAKKYANELVKTHDELKILKRSFDLPRLELHQFWHRSNTTSNRHSWLRNYMHQQLS